ncbi:HAD-superfamily hydrolase subfamily IIB [Stappia aggregata IAM 12614]|uniref:HAD-superfamily hydrolase subfamily IIB n=1 Tax=Roseibium aggregatum (strain ATCC 25650 / DSM 13394 / JCM 20685 / NBRC 16684 / NCIMB 2208 / IAM 12614 / B1) TaxID=384765 RepID=A0NLP7_ROSAI|nr:HAD-IIB family hydrolase [Roseibium aggregatum]EAV45992.1 HAD-superfamily hydrolase subfamily IIB [Stappia aggregata IAM 12614] [Roseibium aggregatum IAM 12614]
MTAETGTTDTWLLVSDIDDTLTGNQADLERLWHQLKTAGPHLKLALNSSRPAVSVDQTLSEYFPDDFEPDAIITGLGTEIRLGRLFLESWQSRFADWPDGEVRAIVRKLGYDAHDDKFQTGGKASFAVPGKDGVDAILAELRSEGIPFRHIYSGTSDLDILAPGAGKDAAMRHLASHLGIPMERTIAAGDSGNDLALFEAAGKAIAVGNARQELLMSLPRDKTYLASAHHAAGVLEGLTVMGLLPQPAV